MKRLKHIFLISLLLFSFACNRGGSQDISGDVVNNPISADGNDGLDQLPKLEFEETTHDFGTVIQGEKVIYSFKFKNAGQSDLLIAKVNASCGCTAIKYPKHPIKPGDGEIITVTFNSEGRRGIQNKSVRIVANTQPNVLQLNIKAMVIQPEKM